MDRFEALNACVIIPTFNNSQTLPKVVESVLRQTSNLIVVNDGSTDNTAEILASFTGVEVISYNQNMGKGYALQQAFKKALTLGFTYAITIDSDGQHKTEELTLFLDAIEANPGALVVGNRRLSTINNLPAKNSFANKISNFWFNFQTGLNLTDTQTGYRLYPLALFNKRRYFSRKYEFELEALVRASWQGIPIVSIPINAYYPPAEERISHFRPFHDFMRISLLNVVLTTLAIVFFLPRRLYRTYKNKKLKDIIKDNILNTSSTNKNLAAAIGFGVFMGIMPVWGYQLLIGFTLAHIFKLNKAVFFLAANISMPPLIPFILYLSYVMGSFVMGHGSWTIDFEMNFEAIKGNLLQYVIGSITLALVAGAVAWLLSLSILPIIRKKKSNG